MAIKRILLLLIIYTTSLVYAHVEYEWAVIGAGTAGIISVDQLLEHGVSREKITWIDSEFCVGRMGKYYGNVPSNQKAFRFTGFLQNSAMFSALDTPATRAIKAYNPDQEHPLQFMVDVFADITQSLKQLVHWQQGTVQSITAQGDAWRINMEEGSVLAHKIILATGSHPKKFLYDATKEINLDIALDEEKLKTHVTPEDTVMVVGSAHSALLVVKYLYDSGVKKIINIYTKQPTFGSLGGLEGITAWWTQNVLQAQAPANIERVLFDAETTPKLLSTCTKVIYAFGYEPNEIIINNAPISTYNAETGVIEKNIYGIGIAFPELYISEEGSFFLIGVNSFMWRAKELLSTWIKD